MPLRSPFPTSLKRVSNSLLAFFCLAFATIILLSLSKSVSAVTETLLSNIFTVLLSFLFMVYGFTLFRIEKNSRLKRSWLFMGLSGVCAIAADGLWFYYESIMLRETFVTPIDSLYWLQYAFLMLGVLSLPFTPLSKKERTIFSLDWLIVLIMGLMAEWYFYIAPVLARAESSPVEIYEIGFMIFVLVVISSIVPLMQREIEDLFGWTPLLLSAGMLLLIAADGFYSYFNLFEIDYPKASLNILWNASQLGLFAALALQLMFNHIKDPRKSAFSTK
ncbi:MAG TPA: hypothetical protein VLH08_08185 [Acidobacteriota bacterium]|nr:hypothetical protein [Acidobacteriota bacterium]